MGKHRRILAIALIAGGVTFGGLAQAGGTSTNDGVCQPQTDHLFPSGDIGEITVTAPEGKLISGYCVKAGSAQQGNGPEYVTLDPPAESVTITHSSGKDISHYIVFYVDKPTTTTIPEVTTTAPEVTTTVPEVTTTVPEVTTTIPEVTTTVPEVTTTVPEVTTTVPEVTTTVPETTTTAPDCTGDPATDPSGCPIDDCNLPGGKPAECDGDSSSRDQHPDTGANTADLTILGLGLVTVGVLLVADNRKGRTK